MYKTALLLALLITSQVAHAAGFTLESPDIKPNGTIATEQVFNGFGCSGDNISPALTWKNAPANTKSFALLVHDPDAPTGGSGWWHWIIVNIPATVTHLPSGAGKADGSALPAGASQVITDFGGPGWGGPCPPVGDKPHHYNFTLYALKVEKIDIPPDATPALAGFMINSNSLGKTRITGLFGRNK